MSGVVVLPAIGALVAGRYQLEGEVGLGGYGIVYEALDTHSGEHVAVKMLLPEAVNSDDVRSRFAREARLASTLQHPNSVKVYSHGVYGGGPGVLGLPFIVMELLDGEDLQVYLSRHPILGVAEVARILMQALGSLAEAHELGIIHRDLKPENLFLCGDQDAVKVLDFGIAKAVSGDWGSSTLRKLTAAGMVCGTPEYMSPEQARGASELTPAVDVYAIGCLAFQMVTGQPPYVGRNGLEVAQRQITDPVPPFPDYVRDSFLGPILTRTLAKDPNERYADAGELLEHLRMAAEEVGLLRNILSPAIVVDDLELADSFDLEVDGSQAGPTTLMPRVEAPTVQPGFDERRRETAPSVAVALDSEASARRTMLLAIPIVVFLLLGLIAVAIVIAWPWLSPLVANG